MLLHGHWGAQAHSALHSAGERNKTTIVQICESKPGFTDSNKSQSRFHPGFCPIKSFWIGATSSWTFTAAQRRESANLTTQTFCRLAIMRNNTHAAQWVQQKHLETAQFNVKVTWKLPRISKIRRNIVFVGQSAPLFCLCRLVKHRISWEISRRNSKHVCAFWKLCVPLFKPCDRRSSITMFSFYSGIFDLVWREIPSRSAGLTQVWSQLINLPDDFIFQSRQVPASC